MMFGRGAEEAMALAAHGIPFRIVPGITAGIGGLAYAGIPVTYRDTNHAVIFLTGHDETGGIPASVDWAAVATAAPVIVMYMAAKHLPSIAEKLIAAGREPRRFAGGRLPRDAAGPVHDRRDARDRRRDRRRDPDARRSSSSVRSARCASTSPGASARSRKIRLASGLIIAAPRSGSGKTLVTLGLIAALRARGIDVAPAKTGPDYIDAAILSRVARPRRGQPRSLGDERRTAAVDRRQPGGDADLLLVEGVMGLFDGAADGTRLDRRPRRDARPAGDPRRRCRAAEPVDRAAGRRLRQLAARGEDRRASSSTASPRCGTRRCCAARSRKPASRCSASLPRRDVAASARAPPRPRPARTRSPTSTLVVAAAGETVAEYIDLDRLLSCGSSASLPLEGRDRGRGWFSGSPIDPHPQPLPSRGRGARLDVRLPPLGQRIAIARDDAFAFLYPHWLSDWRAAGAELSFFSPLADEAPRRRLPTRCSCPAAIPSCTAQSLRPRTRFRAGMTAARDRGALIYGECGGFMVLGATLTDKDGVDPPHGRPARHVDDRIERPKRTLGYRRLAHTAVRCPGPSASTATSSTIRPATHGAGEPAVRRHRCARRAAAADGRRQRPGDGLVCPRHRRRLDLAVARSSRLRDERSEGHAPHCGEATGGAGEPHPPRLRRHPSPRYGSGLHPTATAAASDTYP